MSKPDLTGQKFGRLTVLRLADSKKRGRRSWICRCSCSSNSDVTLTTGALTSGNTRSCGCLVSDTAAFRGKNLVDCVFGRWTVLALSPNRGRTRYWSCQCACGTKREVSGANLASGRSRSCGGCLKGYVTKYLRRLYSREYESWAGMKARCLTTSCNGFDDYGGRGIKVCDRWLHSFVDFLEDMGPRPLGQSIQRLDKEGDYTPDNCEWTTPAEQVTEKRSDLYLEFGGERLIKSDWAKRLGISRWLFEQQLVGHTLADLIFAHGLPPAA
jgi:hypothetical protein